MQSLARDLGFELGVRLCTDSSAALSMCSRIGVGKLRHVAVKSLWLQQAVADGSVGITKISGIFNPADVLTKPQSGDEMSRQLEHVGGEILRRDRPRWADLVDE